VTHVGRDEEVRVGEFKVGTISEDRWLAGEDVVGGHLRNCLPVGGWLRMELGMFLCDFIRGHQSPINIQCGRRENIGSRCRLCQP